MNIRFIYTALVLSLLAPAGIAQHVRFNSTENDLGDIKPLSSATTEFVIHNLGPETLLLADPKASCGCTATLLDKRTLPPGDSATIEVRFSAAPGMMGAMRKTVAVRGRVEGGSEQPLGTLRIDVRIVGSVIYEPGMLRFESVVGDTVTVALKLISHSDETIRIQDISAALLAYVDTTAGNKYNVDAVQTRPFTEFDIRQTEQEIAPGDTTTVYLTLRPGEKGQINGSMRIPIPDGELRVPVVGVVLRTRAP